MSGPRFITLEQVLRIHAEQLARFGGGDGIRDTGLLESAIAQPMATFDGAYLHADLHAMAAAYLFHLVQNHPFVDGNKRTGLVVALVFLAVNGTRVDTAHQAVYDLTISVAEGRIDKQQLAAALRTLFP